MNLSHYLRVVEIDFTSVAVADALRGEPRPDLLAVPRAAIASSTGTGQVLINRLLFDRGIRDREAWIYRRPEQQEEQGEG